MESISYGTIGQMGGTYSSMMCQVSSMVDSIPSLASGTQGSLWQKNTLKHGSLKKTCCLFSWNMRFLICLYPSEYHYTGYWSILDISNSSTKMKPMLFFISMPRQNDFFNFTALSTTTKLLPIRCPCYHDDTVWPTIGMLVLYSPDRPQGLGGGFQNNRWKIAVPWS